MIKAIFFDFDGVLTTDFNGTGTICNNLCKAIPNLSLTAVTDCYRKHCGPLLLGGKFADVWDGFCADVGQKIAPETLKAALRTVPRNEEMFSLVNSLRQKYIIGMITDNPGERMELLDKDMGLTALFDPIIISASVHALKHDGTTMIFDAALQATRVEPSQSIFIDNQQRNLVTPSKMGMKIYWHDDAANDVDALHSTLKQWGV